MSRHMLLIPVDGPVEWVEAPTLEDMRRLLGGGAYVERVRVGQEWALAVDEDGLQKRLPVNPVASVLYGVMTHGTPIVGPALLGREALGGSGEDMGLDWVDTSMEEIRDFFEDKGLMLDA